MAENVNISLYRLYEFLVDCAALAELVIKECRALEELYSLWQILFDGWVAAIAVNFIDAITLEGCKLFCDYSNKWSAV